MQCALLKRYEDTLFHTFTDRSDENIAFHVADAPQNVILNRIALSQKYSYSAQNLVYMDQVHSNHVTFVNDSFVNKIGACDALVTAARKVPLMVMVADCIPILIFDPIQKIIAAVHAGRMGTFQKIVQCTIEKFQGKREDIMVCMGPSIHGCCYEVGKEIADQCEKYIEIREGKYFLDLQTMNYDQLLEMGIKKKISKSLLSAPAVMKTIFLTVEKGKPDALPV